MTVLIGSILVSVQLKPLYHDNLKATVLLWYLIVTVLLSYLIVTVLHLLMSMCFNLISLNFTSRDYKCYSRDYKL